jgi:hypothetical protein
MGRLLFCNGNILKVGKVNYGENKVKSSDFAKDMTKGFTMSCTVDTINSDLEELFVPRGGVDCYIVKGTSGKSCKHYHRYPRKLKKAVKMMYYGVYCRRTKWMNLAIKRNLDYTEL